MGDGTIEGDATGIANRIAWGFGQTMGLRNVSEDGDIICQGVGCGPPNAQRAPGVPLTPASRWWSPAPGAIPSTRTNCPAGQQNSHQELLTILGPARCASVARAAVLPASTPSGPGPPRARRTTEVEKLECA